MRRTGAAGRRLETLSESRNGMVMFAPRSWTRSHSIALIEDDVPLAHLLRYNFEAAGYAVTWHDDGAAALDRILADPPGLVVLDWVLPGLSGIEVLRQMRLHETTRALPVLMLTGCSTPPERSRALRTGADRFLAKPFSVRDVMLALQSLSNGAASRREPDTCVAERCP